MSMFPSMYHMEIVTTFHGSQNTTTRFGTNYDELFAEGLRLINVYKVKGNVLVSFSIKELK